MTSTTDQSREIYSSLGDDPQLGNLVAQFVEEMPQRISAIEQAFAAGLQDDLRRCAHQLKGSAGSYGFDQVTPIAARLEASLRHGDTEEEIAARVGQLVEVCRRVRAGTSG